MLRLIIWSSNGKLCPAVWVNVDVPLTQTPYMRAAQSWHIDLTWESVDHRVTDVRPQIYSHLNLLIDSISLALIQTIIFQICCRIDNILFVNCCLWCFTLSLNMITHFKLGRAALGMWSVCCALLPACGRRRRWRLGGTWGILTAVIRNLFQGSADWSDYQGGQFNKGQEPLGILCKSVLENSHPKAIRQSEIKNKGTELHF